LTNGTVQYKIANNHNTQIWSITWCTSCCHVKDSFKWTCEMNCTL